MPQQRRPPPQQQKITFWQAVVRAEWHDPEAKAANLGLLASVGLFGGAVVLLRAGLGELLVPGF